MPDAYACINLHKLVKSVIRMRAAGERNTDGGSWWRSHVDWWHSETFSASSFRIAGAVRSHIEGEFKAEEKLA